MIISGGLDKEFDEYMEELGRKHERSKVYVDFMDYYIYQNSESNERKLPSGYTDKEMKLFDKAYHSFVELMQKLIEKYGWYDYLGEYYEEYILAGSKASSKGQFYTPRQISGLLSEIVGCDVGMNEAYDPACGSARNLCEYHSRHPNVRCTGEDLDESACKMAVVNFSCHGVNGVVNWIDALTREYMGTSWKTINGEIFITDMDWIRATEDIMNAVSILTLSDDTIRQLLEGVAKTFTIIDEGEKPVVAMKENNQKKDVLDDWL
jgi:type I restriction-modification system DNA methylase subunit